MPGGKGRKQKKNPAINTYFRAGAGAARGGPGGARLPGPGRPGAAAMSSTGGGAEPTPGRGAAPGGGTGTAASTAAAASGAPASMPGAPAATGTSTRPNEAPGQGNSHTPEPAERRYRRDTAERPSDAGTGQGDMGTQGGRGTQPGKPVPLARGSKHRGTTGSAPTEPRDGQDTSGSGSFFESEGQGEPVPSIPSPSGWDTSSDASTDLGGPPPPKKACENDTPPGYPPQDVQHDLAQNLPIWPGHQGLISPVSGLSIGSQGSLPVHMALPNADPQHLGLATLGWIPTGGFIPPMPVSQASQGIPPNWSPTNLESELRSMMKTLPSKQEIEASLSTKFDKHTDRIEKKIQKEMLSMREVLTKLTDKVKVMESEMKTTQQKIYNWETSFVTLHRQFLELTLQVNDLDNRGRRNNIRVRGLPESVGNSDLRQVVSNILNTYLDRPHTEIIEFDRIHRSFGGKANKGNHPRDVICCLHKYALKESIMRKAWEKGPIPYAEAQITLLQDLARRTLIMRRLVKPLLQEAIKKGASYKWGYPFSVIFKLNNRTFELRTHSQLDRAFDFLGVDRMDIPDWILQSLDPLERPPG